MDAVLKGRLAKLRLEPDADCCRNLPDLVADAKAAPGLDEARKRYEALADPSRLLAAAMIRRHPGLCGCELQAGLGLTHATVSHHMRILHGAGLVQGERRGRWTHYRLTEAGLALVP